MLYEFSVIGVALFFFVFYCISLVSAFCAGGIIYKKNPEYISNILRAMDAENLIIDQKEE